MLLIPRQKSWIIAVDEEFFQIEFHQRFCQGITLVVNGSKIEWDLTLLDILDLGGSFPFKITTIRRDVACSLEINMAHVFLVIDGKTIDGKRLFTYSFGRILLRFIILLLCMVVSFRPFFFQTIPN